MIVTVPFKVPVDVVVDTETGYVSRVVIVDELVEPDPEGGFRANGATLDVQKDAPLMREALEMAESAPEWPGWEFGW